MAELELAQATPQSSEEIEHKFLWAPLKQKLGRIGLSFALSVGGGVLGAISSEVIRAPEQTASAETDGYPWDQAGAVDLSSVHGPYTWGYEDCLSGMNCNVSETMNGKKYYYQDSRGYDIKNCTSYAAWRVAKEFGKDISGWRNADKWDDNAKGTYTVDTTPEPGDLAVWDSMHVAFVESVNNDGSVNIAQYNRGGNGQFSRENNRRADHYIDINGEGIIWGSSTTTSGNKSYASIGEGGEFYSDEGWVYTKVGGAAWPIKQKNDWNTGDKNLWSGGNDLVGPVSTAESHDHEVGWSGNSRSFGVHPPGFPVAVYEQGGNGQQYYFIRGKAYPIGPGEIDDLGVRNKALPIPQTGDRLSDFTGWAFPMTHGEVYRGAGSNRVNQYTEGPNGIRSYHVNNDTVLECLRVAYGHRQLVIPQSAVSSLWTQELGTPAACTFPPGMVLRGPGGLEQWRIEGNNVSQTYSRRYYPNALLTYLHTSGNPIHIELEKLAAINGIAQGPDMVPPNGTFFLVESNGDQFYVDNGIYRKIPWPDMNSCMYNTNPIRVPGHVVSGLQQGPQMTCPYENRIIYGPDGAQYYVNTQSRRQYIGTAAISACITARRGAGTPFQASAAAVNSYVLDGKQAYCNYEQEPGLNFVRENGDPTVWLVGTGGIKRHVGSLCVSDAETTAHKKFHLFVVPTGETAGHTVGPDWFASGEACAALPG